MMGEYLRLLEHMAAHCGQDSGWIQSCVAEPKWEEIYKVHNWRHYIPGYLKNIWQDLSQETRAVSVALAQERADMEIWE